MMAEPVPLTRKQVKAAAELRFGSRADGTPYMPELAKAFDKLVRLGGPDGALDLSATKARVEAVNGQFRARARRDERKKMAEYVWNKWSGSPPACRDTVVEIASNCGRRKCLALASKYMFFYGEGPFSVPIWDSLARSQLRYHRGYQKGDYADYSAFHDDAVLLLKGLDDPSLSFKDLDAYLWLSAQHASESGGEVANLFSSRDLEVLRLVAAMVPTPDRVARLLVERHHDGLQRLAKR